jgi:hypothetical protein
MMLMLRQYKRCGTLSKSYGAKRRRGWQGPRVQCSQYTLYCTQLGISLCICIWRCLHSPCQGQSVHPVSTGPRHILCDGSPPCCLTSPDRSWQPEISESCKFTDRNVHGDRKNWMLRCR